jgi:hypothetical protein
MTTTAASNLKPEHAESHRWPTLVPVPADMTAQDASVR